MGSKLVDIHLHSDPERGHLAVIEANNQIPFEIKRVFYIFGTREEVRRGGHAHFKTKQALIAVSGECKVTLDNLKRKKIVELNSPSEMLILEPNDWHEMYDFTDDCVLLVLASHYYDEQDYIRDYAEFKKIYS